MVGVLGVIALEEVWVVSGSGGWEVMRWRGVSGAGALLAVVGVEEGCTVGP